MPLVRRVEHARGDGRPRRAAQAADGGRGWRRARLPGPGRRRRRGASPSGRDRASSTACSAAAWSPGRSCCSAASPASASPRSCSRSRRASPAGSGVLYATGEESGAQVRLRAARLGLTTGVVAERIHVVAETGVDRIVELARGDLPGLLVVDSVQTVASDELDGPPGSVGQVREAALRLMELAKADGVPVVLVGHVTKDGTLAGPEDARAPRRRRALDRGRPDRRAAPAARDEEPVRVDRGGRRVRDGRPGPRRGRRPGAGLPRRPRRAGVGQRRRARSSRGRARCSSRCRRWWRRAARRRPVGPPRASTTTASPCWSPSSAGAPASACPGTTSTPTSPAASRSASPASTSRSPSRWRRRCATGRSVDGTVAIGEVGLLGELRAVGGLDRRLREAARLGFTRAVVPRSRGRSDDRVPGVEVVEVGSLAEALAGRHGRPRRRRQGPGLRATPRLREGAVAC